MTTPVKEPKKSSNIKVLALGSPAAIAIMQLDIVKSALDFKFYEWHINMYSPLLALFVMLFLIATVVTGGIYLTKKTYGD